MNVNGVTSINDTYQTYQKTDAISVTAETTSQATDTESKVESGVVYEPTLEMPTKTYQANTEMINRLKLDAQARLDQLQAIVNQLISKQSNAFANATDMWSILRNGDFEVDPETKAQAQADIAEDGYWGVNQTSDRIVDFAMALTGGDPDKVDSMIEAFKKGYKQAEETWGGELPEISKKTYDEVLRKFDEIKNKNVTEAEA